MTERRVSVRARVLAGIAVAAAGLVTLIVGREALSIFIGLASILAYVELRRIFIPGGRAVALLIGSAGVLGFLFVAYEGDLERLAWVAAGLVLLLLTTAVVIHETGRSQRVTNDVAGTLAASGLVGVLAAHALLIRSVPVSGFRGFLAFGLMVLLNDAFAFFGGRAFGARPLSSRLQPAKTWEGAVCGFVATVCVGLVCGLVLDPPFDLRSGLLFGAGMGVLVPIGDVTFAALKRGAEIKGSDGVFGALGGALDVVDGLLFAAPAFYWAFRTIAL